jgi:hypothetical protein
MVLLAYSVAAVALRGQELQLAQFSLSSANAASNFIIIAVPQLDIPHPSAQKPFLRQSTPPLQDLEVTKSGLQVRNLVRGQCYCEALATR